MHGFMQISFVIIGLTLTSTLPQNYNYDNIKLSNIPINYDQSINNDYRSFITSDNSQQQQQQQQHISSNKPLQYYNKQFFIHTAPEDPIDLTQNLQNIQNSLKKNLQVLFIKAPSNNGLKNAAEQLAKEQTSEQTVIYVLNKYTDTVELQNNLNKLNDINPNKPEVHFIQYKTNEDADNAQNSIQLQYNTFGDGSPLEIINEGKPDIISYIGLTNQQQSQQSSNQQITFNNNVEQSFHSNGISIGNLQTNIANAYLPPPLH